MGVCTKARKGMTAEGGMGGTSVEERREATRFKIPRSDSNQPFGKPFETNGDIKQYWDSDLWYKRLK